MTKHKSKKNPYNNINYYETTGSAGTTPDEACLINKKAMEAVSGNILSDTAPAYENTNGGPTTPPNATSISHG